MKLITKRSLIQNVAKKWREHYQPFCCSVLINGKTKERIAEELDAIDGNTATEKQVVEIIGNGSWTGLMCNECGCGPDAVIQVGEEPDYESATASLCPTCVEKAALLLARRPNP